MNNGHQKRATRYYIIGVRSFTPLGKIIAGNVHESKQLVYAQGGWVTIAYLIDVEYQGKVTTMRVIASEVLNFTTTTKEGALQFTAHMAGKHTPLRIILENGASVETNNL